MPTKTGDAVFLILALILAAVSLFAASRHMSHSVWFDESQTVFIARQPTLAALAKEALRERPYPPLFFLIVRSSLEIRNDEPHLRWPSAIFGALATVAVFLLGRGLADAQTGLSAALLFVFTPGMFRYFVDGNAYTMLALFSALALLYFFRAVRGDQVMHWLPYSAFSLLGLATHSIFVFSLFGHGLTGLSLKAFARSGVARSWIRFIASMSVLGLASLVWIYVSVRFGGQVRPFHTSLSTAAYSIVTAAAMYVGPLSFGSLGLLAVWGGLQALGIVALFRRNRTTFWFVVLISASTLTATAFFLLSTIPFVAYRYGIAIFPLACVVAAAAPKAIASREPTRRAFWAMAARAAAIAGLLVCALNGAVYLAVSSGDVFQYQDWRSVAGFLRTNAAVGDTILYSPYERLPLAYYDHGPARMIELNQMADKAAAAPAELAARSNQRVWILLSTTANENAFVARYTQQKRDGLETVARSLIATLQGEGLSASVAARFHRIDVVVATAGGRASRARQGSLGSKRIMTTGPRPVRAWCATAVVNN